MVSSPRKPTRASTRRAPHLEPDKVVLTALILLNEVGFEGLTLRKLADKLGVKAAALYWHFKNKQDLIDQVASRIIEEQFAERTTPEDADWRTLLTGMGYGSRNAFRRYRDGALVIAKADLSKTNAYKSRDYIMGHLLQENFPPDMILDAMYSINRYALGCVLEEQADPLPGAERTAFELLTLPEIAVQFPVMATVFSEAKASGKLESDARFHSGLQVILDGLAAQLAAHRRS